MPGFLSIHSHDSAMVRHFRAAGRTNRDDTMDGLPVPTYLRCCNVLAGRKGFTSDGKLPVCMSIRIRIAQNAPRKNVAVTRALPAKRWGRPGLRRFVHQPRRFLRFWRSEPDPKFATCLSLNSKILLAAIKHLPNPRRKCIATK